MEFLNTNRRFSEFAVGYISFGIGQQLIRSGFIQPWAEDKESLLVLGLLGLLFLSIGLFFLVRELIWIFRQYNQDNRVTKLIGVALGLTILSGLVIGFLGQTVYDHSTFGYLTIKNVMWVVISIIQSMIKIMMIYVLVTFYRSSEFSLKNKDFQKLLFLAGIITAITAAISLGIPVIAPVLLYLVDVTIVLGTLYYLIKQIG